MSHSRSWFPLRLVIYLVITSLCAACVCELVLRLGPRPVLKENSLIEWVQIGVLALTALVLIAQATRADSRAVLLYCLGGAAVLAILRECDALLEDLLFDRAHTVLAAPVAIALLAYAWRMRARVWPEMREYVSRPGFALMLIGVFIVIAWAQVLGQRVVWKLFEPKDLSAAKRFMEEGLEFFGYQFVFFGALEEAVFSRSREGDSG